MALGLLQATMRSDAQPVFIKIHCKATQSAERCHLVNGTFAVVWAVQKANIFFLPPIF